MDAATSERVISFFGSYARAASSGDAETISAAYFSPYIETAPSRVESFEIDANYRRAVKVKAEAMRHLGLVLSAAEVVATTPLAPNHLLVDVEWRLAFEPSGKTRTEKKFRISYVVRQQNGRLKILLALSHEDEEQALKELDLT